MSKHQRYRPELDGFAGRPLGPTQFILVSKAWHILLWVTNQEERQRLGFAALETQRSRPFAVKANIGASLHHGVVCRLNLERKLHDSLLPGVCQFVDWAIVDLG